MKFNALSLAIFISFFQTPAFSANTLDPAEDYFDDFYGGDDFVEIATGIDTQIHKAPAVASVFTSREISAMGAMDIDDVLETVPGLHINRSYNAYLPVYTFRGIHSAYNPQVLMLVNGVPITNNFLGNRNQVWGGMPLEAVERIEVIRGPGSAVYGADAFAGVINIITKSASDIKRNSLGIRGGQYSTNDAWFQIASEEHEVNYALTVEYHKTDGNDKIIESDAQSVFDNLFSTNASNAPGALNLSTTNLDIRAELGYKNLGLRIGLQERKNNGIGAGLAEALDPEAKQASTRINADLTYSSKLTEYLSHDVVLAYFDTTQEVENQYRIYPRGYKDSFFDGVFENGFIGNPEVYERHYRANWTGLYSGLEGHTFRFGFGFHRSDLYKTTETKNFAIGPGLNFEPIIENGNFVGVSKNEQLGVIDVSDTPFEFLQETKRDNRYVFVQDVWALANDWELTAGVRHDDYSDFGSTTNPRIALVWSSSLNLSTKLLYGKAFRAPSFADRGNQNNPVAVGNPNIKPEEIESIELSFDYHPDDGVGAVASFYHYTWTDIIQYVPNGSANVAQNEGKQKGYGAELELYSKLSENVKFSGNYAYINAENKQTGREVAFTPSNQVYLQLDWKASDSVGFHVRNNYVSGRKRQVGDIRNEIDDYWITDLTLQWQPDMTPVTLKVIGKNIFDSDAREPSATTQFTNGDVAVYLQNDLPLPGRGFYAELRYEF
ncbi:TonB-dependent receptor plug domain-containing protein [Saccharobesus litoralis]|nr:TonB-dependent receptor [Saccharobesus litoralis]